jgi:hypothetical protein
VSPELPTAGERQHVNHLALPVDTLEEFDAAYQRLKDHGVAVTEIIERGYGKTFRPLYVAATGSG